ncbi:hypothetical protein MBH78_18045 [Oceanimonas sp. NS1]|nr:hypothetical protein [Oceanimonas sp. NS1]
MYAISRNFTNFFGELEDGVYASACDNGVGAAWGTISGTLLAEMAVGADTQALRDISPGNRHAQPEPARAFPGAGCEKPYSPRQMAEQE